MTDSTPDGQPPDGQTPDGQTPDGLTPDGLTPSAATPTKGLSGWLQRRAEAMLRRPRRAIPALSEPGEFQVVLQVTGASPVRVITVISEASGLDFMSASRLVQDAPAVVVSQISEASAEMVVERLKKAGAKAVAGESYRPH